MSANVNVKVIASTPGADSSVYNMFNSTVTFQGGGLMQTMGGGIGRLEFTVVNSQAGTLKFYRSIDKGTNWDQVGGDIAVAANSATDISGPYDYLVDPYQDVKLDWVNGGSAQATWRPAVTLIPRYHGAAT